MTGQKEEEESSCSVAEFFLEIKVEFMLECSDRPISALSGLTYWIPNYIYSIIQARVRQILWP